MSKCQYTRFLGLKCKKAKRGFGDRKEENVQETIVQKFDA